MRYHEKTSVYNSDWDSVTSAFWVKYPNDRSKFVKSVDTIARDIDEENQILKVRRIIALEYGMPSWMEKIFNCKMHGLALEETTVDLKRKNLELKSWNLGLSRFLQSEEVCTYSQHPDDPENKTLYKTKLSVRVKGLGGGGGSSPRNSVKTVDSNSNSNSKSELISDSESQSSTGSISDTASMTSTQSSSSPSFFGFSNSTEYLRGILESQFINQAANKFENGLDIMRSKIAEVKELYVQPGGLYGIRTWESCLKEMKQKAVEKAKLQQELEQANQKLDSSSLIVSNSNCSSSCDNMKFLVKVKLDEMKSKADQKLEKIKEVKNELKEELSMKRVKILKEDLSNEIDDCKEKMSRQMTRAVGQVVESLDHGAATEKVANVGLWRRIIGWVPRIV